MVSEPSLKLRGCKTYIGFGFTGSRHLGLVDDPFSEAISFQGAFFLLLTVACSFGLILRYIYESCGIYTNLAVYIRILLYIYESCCIYTNLDVYIRILMYIYESWCIYTNLDVYIRILMYSVDDADLVKLCKQSLQRTSKELCVAVLQASQNRVNLLQRELQSCREQIFSSVN